MEYWDLYDENGKSLHRTHLRGMPMEGGTYHLGVDVWTVNSKGEILITLRDPEKDDCPGEWENTCGSVIAGETPVQGALRELREETGIIVEAEELRQILYTKGSSTLSYTYLLMRDVDLHDIVFQPGETVDARFVTPDEIDSLILQGTARPLAERWPRVRKTLAGMIHA